MTEDCFKRLLSPEDSFRRWGLIITFQAQLWSMALNIRVSLSGCPEMVLPRWWVQMRNFMKRFRKNTARNQVWRERVTFTYAIFLITICVYTHVILYVACKANGKYIQYKRYIYIVCRYCILSFKTIASTSQKSLNCSRLVILILCTAVCWVSFVAALIGSSIFYPDVTAIAHGRPTSAALTFSLVINITGACNSYSHACTPAAQWF